MENKTYEEFIQNILDTRGRFNCKDMYHERHHIVPKCMNGNDDVENLIDLYAREHFEAHRLLALENPDNESLIYAWHMMSVMNNNGQRDYEVTAEEYEEARIAHSIACSEKMSGSGNPMYGKVSAMYGKHHTEDAKKKLSEARKGENNPMFGKFGVNAPNYGKQWSDESRKKLSAANSGKNNGSARAIVQLNKNTGALIKIWDYIKQASDELKINRKKISSCCRGKIEFVDDFVFKYLEDYKKE